MSRGVATPMLVKVSALMPSPTNPRKRFDETALAELSRSIDQVGLLSPILCREIPDADPKSKVKYEIVAGERRWRAAKLSNLKDIPIVLRELSDDEVIECQIVENLQRVDVDPLDEARCLQVLSERMTIGDIAGKIGRSWGFVNRRLKLLALRPEIQNALETGEVTLAWAEIAATIPEEMQADALVAFRGYYGPKTVGDLKVWVLGRSSRFEAAQWDPNDENLLPMAGKCSACAFNSANSLFDEGGGHICQNRQCFQAKTDAWFERIQQSEGAAAFDPQTHRMIRPDEEPPDHAFRAVSQQSYGLAKPGEPFMVVLRSDETGASSKADRKAELARQKLENKYRHLLSLAISEAIPQDMTWEGIEPIIRAHISTTVSAFQFPPMSGAKYSGVGIPDFGIPTAGNGNRFNESVEATWASFTPSQLAHVILGVAARREVPYGDNDYQRVETPKVLLAYADLLSIDLDHIRKEAEISK